MVILTFFTTMISSATISIPQVLIVPMIETFEWKISEITTSIAIMYIILAASSFRQCHDVETWYNKSGNHFMFI